MKTSVEEQAGSRVRVDVEVPPEDVGRALQRAARGLAREMRMPGFRKGKAPPSLVIQRLGRGAVMDEALRSSLAEWYERALLESGIAAVGDPDLEVDSVPESDSESLGFHFEIGVRPQAQLGDYKGVEVAKADSEVPADVIDQEIERLRDGLARLDPVERPAQAGDSVLIDFVGKLDGEEFEGGSATDQLLELGSGRLIEGFEEQLTGAAAGDSVKVEVTFPEDYGAEHLAGRDATFEVEVKEVREKILPELDDDFAAEASEHDTLDELREDIRSRMSEAASSRIEDDFRIAVVDAVVDGATVVVPDALAEARSKERWERLERQIRSQGMDPDAYLQMQGKTRDEIVEEGKEEAERELRRDAVLAAVAEAEGLEASEEEMIEALRHTAEHHENTTPEKLLSRLRREGRDRLIAEDIKIRQALDLLAESAKPISMEQAEAREKLWTPG